ncbi:MAG: hypothetical protein KIS92_26955, partial [Planctomycetota bacterium]|nr:hypothetical protein [Planctomycetota bacterium]
PGLRLAGGLPAAAALCAPGDLRLADTRGVFETAPAEAAYKSAGASARLSILAEKPDEQALADWLAD